MASRLPHDDPDAVVQLQLKLDPTMRVRVTEPIDESGESKAVTTD
jgi:hypothetical protein